MSILPWLLCALSLFGLILNTHKNRSGFIVWGVSNIGWAIQHSARGNWADTIMFIVFTAFCIYGFISWGRTK